MNLRHKLVSLSIGLLILIVIGYSLFTSRNFIRGPYVDILEPTDGAFIATSSVVIRGIAHNATFISLNDQPILVDEQGNFAEIRLLEEGYNVYKVFIKDKFNRSTEKILRLYMHGL